MIILSNVRIEYSCDCDSYDFMYYCLLFIYILANYIYNTISYQNKQNTNGPIN